MPPLALEIHPQAVAEARAAGQWYRARSPAAANAFIEELDSAIHRILQGPERFPPYLYNTRWCRLRRFPYLVIFRQAKAVVQVIAVAHGRRRPGYWKARVRQ